ncbi:MAG: hypothetical protein RBU45_22250 [Myxococcota bacterium]|jgi:hypothetical protein|nr:hypothetical protein [Myxococcota bacterium]
MGSYMHVQDVVTVSSSSKITHVRRSNPINAEAFTDVKVVAFVHSITGSPTLELETGMRDDDPFYRPTCSAVTLAGQ